MAKRLWIATYEIEVLVAAESEDEAQDALSSEWMSISMDIDTADFDICKATYLPGDWENNSIPYGADGDKTVGEYIAEGGFGK